MKNHVKSPDTVRALNRNINVVLVAVLIDTLDYPDKALPLQQLQGLPICGDIAYDSGVYRKVEPEENVKDFNNRFEQWIQSHDEWFQEGTQNLIREASAKMARANGDARKLDTFKKICHATKVEVGKELMGPPLSETELRRKYEVDGKLTKYSV